MTQSDRLSPVIILGAHTVGLGVLRAFSNMNIERVVVSYDRKDMGRASRYVTHLLDAPHPESNQKEFIDFLIKLADQYPGAMLIPASDATLSAVSRWKGELSRYYSVACAEWEIVEQLIDKKRTYALAESIGVPVPHTMTPHSEADVERYAQTAAYPCLVKPCQGHLYFEVFHHKMVRAQNYEELLAAYRAAAAAGLEVVLQEYIPGDDSEGVNYNAYFWNGQPLVEFTARKIRNAPPELGSPCALISAEVPEVYQAGRKLLSALGFYGYACTEFKRDARDGEYKLMEVNGRHNLSTLLAVRCNLNFPVLHYRHLMLGEVPAQSDYQKGIYWIDLTRDFAYHLRRVVKGKYPLKSFIEPYQHEHIFAILDTKDFRPFSIRVKALLQDAFSGKRSL